MDLIVICTIISTSMAVLQLVAAVASLRAAWKIAYEQKAEASRAKNLAREQYIEAVASLAREALHEADKATTALSSMRNSGGTAGILQNFKHRLDDIHDALQPLRSASPADASLMLAVGRLSRALQATPEAAPFDSHLAAQAVNRVSGSIGIELGKITGPTVIPFETAGDEAWEDPTQ